jgi:hypothetical protein
VGRIVLLAVSATALAAYAASPASAQARPMRIEFGIGGGNTLPFQITIGPTGSVRSTGASSFIRPERHHLSQATVASLSALVRDAFASGVSSRQCSGTNPDVGSDFIRAARRSVTVHGSCEPRFTKLWDALARAVRLKVA